MLQWLGLSAFTASLVAKKKKKKRSIKNFGNMAKFLFTEIFNFFMKDCPVQPAPCAIKLYVRKGVLKDFRK